MREIVMNTGNVALVDDADYEWLSRFHWTEHPQGYAMFYNPETKRSMFMHRFLMGAQPGQIIDHIDRNKANNQRNNLRFCTHAENMRNRNPTKLPRWKKNGQRVPRAA